MCCDSRTDRDEQGRRAESACRERRNRSTEKTQPHASEHAGQQKTYTS